MTLPLSLLLFLGSSALALSALLAAKDGLLLGGTLGIALSGIHIVLAMALRRWVYTAASFLFHLTLTILTVYIYLNRDLVISSREMVFSVFTDENLRTALVALLVTLQASLAPWCLMVRRQQSLTTLSARQSFETLVGRLDELFSKARIQLTLAASLVLAVTFVSTNTTVLEQPYPSNLNSLWHPYELLRCPTLIAAVGLAASYSKWLRHGRSYLPTLNLARINFLLTLTLMLLLVGSRGLFIMLWVLAGLFELGFFLKRRGTPAWGMLFLILAWFSYYSWPFLRVNLSSIPADRALLQALDISLLRSAPSGGFRNQAGIHVEDYAMLGTSVFHLLYVVQLTKDGSSLRGSTFINLIPQAVPDFLTSRLWDRPVNDNWRLAEHYYHGGGFLAVANAYWNGGLLTMSAYVLVISTLFLGLDRYLARRATKALYKAVYWLWLPVMVVQLGYGIQGLARVIELLGAMILIDQINQPNSCLRRPGMLRSPRRWIQPHGAGNSQL